jgi:hypothetical protein
MEEISLGARWSVNNHLEILCLPLEGKTGLPLLQ